MAAPDATSSARPRGRQHGPAAGAPLNLGMGHLQAAPGTPPNHGSAGDHGRTTGQLTVPAYPKILTGQGAFITITIR